MDYIWCSCSGAWELLEIILRYTFGFWLLRIAPPMVQKHQKRHPTPPILDISKKRCPKDCLNKMKSLFRKVLLNASTFCHLDTYMFFSLNVDHSLKLDIQTLNDPICSLYIEDISSFVSWGMRWSGLPWVPRFWGPPGIFREIPRSEIRMIRVGPDPAGKCLETLFLVTLGYGHWPRLLPGWWFFVTPLKNMTSSIGMISNPILMGK